MTQWTTTVIACLLLLDGSLPGQYMPLGRVRALVSLASLLCPRANPHQRRTTAAVKGGGLPVDATRSRWLQQRALSGGSLDQAGGVAYNPGRRGGASSPSFGGIRARSRARARSLLAHAPHTAARGFVMGMVRVTVMVAMATMRAIQFPFQRRQAVVQ